MNEQAYIDLGYKSRQDYLESLSRDYGVDLDTVLMLAGMFGPKGDFDMLINAMNTESW